MQDPAGSAHISFMTRALELAARAWGETSPNPLVGAVVVRGGREMASAWHRRAGTPHAETLALEAAREAEPRGDTSSRDLTLYVNLEPCAHHGRTPPCAEAILAAPVQRVVAAMSDPDPRVAGRGFDRLRGAGVEVEVGCLEAEAAELNHVFVARQLRRRPFVALKVALSADGCIAAADGAPAEITSGVARRHAHRLRAGHDAILVGVETLRRDRPRLDRRLYDGPGTTPRRLVIDPQLRSEPEWLWPGEARAVLFCTRRARDARGWRLRDAAEIVPLPESAHGLDLSALVEALEGLGAHSVLVEGGGRTHRGFLAAGLWDRVYVYSNPGLQLRGLAWAARAEWQRQRSTLEPRQRLQLGGDRLEVFAHPASLRGTARPS